MTRLPPSLRSPIIFSDKSHWMAHWFYPAALSVGRGAGATVIAFNIINIISHIIWAETTGIRKEGGVNGSCHHPGSLAVSLVYQHMQNAHILTHSHPITNPTTSFHLITATSLVTPGGQSHPTCSILPGWPHFLESIFCKFLLANRSSWQGQVLFL